MGHLLALFLSSMKMQYSTSNKEVLRDKLYTDYERGMSLIQKRDCGKLQKRKDERELIFSKRSHF